jgi:hypothetical protein
MCVSRDIAIYKNCYAGNFFTLSAAAQLARTFAIVSMT